MLMPLDIKSNKYLLSFGVSFSIKTDARITSVSGTHLGNNLFGHRTRSTVWIEWLRSTRQFLCLQPPDGRTTLTDNTLYTHRAQRELMLFGINDVVPSDCCVSRQMCKLFIIPVKCSTSLYNLRLHQCDGWGSGWMNESVRLLRVPHIRYIRIDFAFHTFLIPSREPSLHSSPPPIRYEINMFYFLLLPSPTAIVIVLYVRMFLTMHSVILMCAAGRETNRLNGNVLSR